ncbi:MAG TPA: hydrogenase maturation nickel metallochaperone HypA [Dyella sp.]|uniref:hydrogenase maturation nickel metallochaperone HypA/HybF n=1 Tax=Dyella sp. TaxID=1869338 RepID=UPI002CDD5C40|nr:hydrogenase maturation nickel metallochaperone HypA [Dyella sp.]HUB88391.1 hydrogenase maturation nickel metallochaperone HypA [Dyella sp.]
MHELSICRALLDQVEILAAEHGAQRVASITLSVGPLSGVEPDLLQATYPLASSGTIADGARLKIMQTPLRVRCEQCGAETAATSNRLVCGACGHWRTVLISGDELLLTDVELTT